MQQVRLKFEKKDNIVFISHLDLSRLFARAFKRAGIPLWYTEGFNPHANIVFSPPLSVGYKSICETADIKLNEDCSDIIQKINNALPSGLKILDAYAPINKISDIEFAEYKIILFNEDYSRIQSLLFNDNELLVEKKSKTKIQSINIKEHLIKCEAERDGGNVVIDVLLPAGNSFSVNPALLITAMKCNNAEYTRTRFLTKDKNELV